MKHLQRQAWSQIVQQVNGIALAGTLAALHRRGAFELLAARGSLTHLEGNRAYLQAAEKVLKSLGWLSRDGLTERGAGAAAKMDFYLRTIDQMAAGEAVDWSQVARELPSNNPPDAQLRGHLQGLFLKELYPGFSPREKIFEHLQWSNSREWTELGRAALGLCGVYDYPISYEPLLARAQDLLFGDHRCIAVTGEEHLDRNRDVKFSGEVFSPALAKPFLSLLLPLFNSSDPPQSVVDVGCGDGAVLETVAKALPTQPLLVAADYSPIARRRAEERLGRLGRTHLNLFADIGDPELLWRSLEEQGVNPKKSVFINKSVIHNRSYLGNAGEPSGEGGWVSPEGAALCLQDVERDLARFFQGWRRFVHRHGMVVAEPYLVKEETVAKFWDRSLQPCLALTHAYSCQLLVPRESFLRAAREAGFKTEIACDLGQTMQGHSAMLVLRLR